MLLTYSDISVFSGKVFDLARSTLRHFSRIQTTSGLKSGDKSAKIYTTAKD